MSDLSSRIESLDATELSRILQVIARQRIRSHQAVELPTEPALMGALGARPGGPVAVANLARACLLLLADDPEMRPILDAMVENPPAESFGPNQSVLTVAAAALVVLQAYFQFAHTPERGWSVAPIKKPLSAAPLDRVIAGLGGGVGGENSVSSSTNVPAFHREQVLAALKALPSHVTEAMYESFHMPEPGQVTPEQCVNWAETVGPGLEEFVVKAHRVDPLAGFLQKVNPRTRSVDAALDLSNHSFSPDGAESVGLAPDASATTPVLVAVDGAERVLDVRGFEVVSRSGRIVAGRGNRAALHELSTHPHVISVEASPPIGQPECAVSVPYVRAHTVHSEYEERGDRVLVGVIDVGIDVLHEAFRDENGNSRIVAVWDQRTSVGPPPSGESFGTYHSREDIARYVTNKAVERGLVVGYECHGTHVASIAAGRACGGANGFKGGVAPGAKLIVVVAKLDPEPGSPGSLGYSVSHWAALNFIKRVASQEPGKPPVVVNVSLGAQAGGHDGTSLLELMFDEFSGNGRTPGLVVVKSAGNDGERRLHAKVPVNSNMVARLVWESPAQKSTSGRRRDVFDCWFSPFDELRFKLVDPNGHESPEVSWANPRVQWSPVPGNVCELEYVRFDKDSGDSRLRILIKGTGAAIQEKRWQLKITSGTLKKPMELHAWIDRIFDPQPVEFVSHMTLEGTLSVPGTAKTVIAVGAVTATDPIEVPTFASQGRTRDGREKPEVSAPGVGVNAADSHSVSGARPESGTSMAAPHVTGAVALLLSQAAKKGRSLNAN